MNRSKPAYPFPIRYIHMDFEAHGRLEYERMIRGLVERYGCFDYDDKCHEGNCVVLIRKAGQESR